MFCFIIISPHYFQAFGRKDHLKNHVWRHVNKVHESTLYGAEGRKGDHRSLGGPGRGSSGWSEEFMCVCIRCESKEEFKGITNFSEHMLTFHLDVGIVCPVCDKQPFNSKKLLKTHLILHTDRKSCCPVSHRVSINNLDFMHYIS